MYHAFCALSSFLSLVVLLWHIRLDVAHVLKYVLASVHCGESTGRVLSSPFEVH
jgi:hypothetical protein